MKNSHKAALERIRAARFPDSSNTSVVKWIPKHTRLKGKPFSYKGHEYQKFVMSLAERDLYIRKCSQIGITEIMLRKVLAFSQIYPGTTTIYSLPVAGLATKISKTRFSPMLRESYPDQLPTVAGNDSAEMKEFRNGSLIFFVGSSASSTSVISLPADQLLFDEIDFAIDPNLPSKLNSRLTHSEHKLKTALSTPTLPGYGISAGYETARQFVELQKCAKCNHHWEVSYFSDVKIPGFDGDMREFNYQNRRILEKYDISQAYLCCPKCGRVVNPFESKREFVQLNLESKALSVGVQISPFAAFSFIELSSLIMTACDYKSYADFVNFSLGLPYADGETTLTREDLDKLFIYGFVPSSYSCMGLDMGGQSACLTASPTRDGLVVTRAEMIPIDTLSSRVGEIKAEDRCIIHIVDSLPYSETVLKFQKKDINCFGAIYGKNTQALYDIREKDDTKGTALSGMRLVKISRDKMLDHVAASLKSGSIKFNNIDSETKEMIISHCLDMKRVKRYDKEGELFYTWVKSEKGEDHFFHALAYLMTGSLMKGFDEFSGPPALGLVSPVGKMNLKRGL